MIEIPLTNIMIQVKLGFSFPECSEFCWFFDSLFIKLIVVKEERRDTRARMKGGYTLRYAFFLL